MKTPREVLFKRHQSAEAKLDKISEQVAVEHLAASDGKKLRVFSPAFVMMKLWQELVWPCRRIWAGMAAVWFLILVFSLATGERETVVADNSPPPTPEVLMVLKEQRQMLAQLLEPAAPAPVDRPRIPGPRSEQRQTLAIG